jgi:DNA-binding HxlR family transcriptional regulator
MKKIRSNCPLTSALDIIGDKWTLVIIRDLFLGKKTFTEFIKSKEKIATNILSNRLELLAQQKIISVTKLPNDQKTKIYYLTDSGIDLYPIIYEMMHWSRRNLKKEFGLVGKQIFLDSMDKSSKAFIMETTQGYKSIRQDILNQLN